MNEEEKHKIEEIEIELAHKAETGIPLDARIIFIYQELSGNESKLLAITLWVESAIAFKKNLEVKYPDKVFSIRIARLPGRDMNTNLIILDIP